MQAASARTVVAEPKRGQASACIEHDGHGCCQDPHRRRRRYGAATPAVLSLVGVRETRIRPGLGLTESVVASNGDLVPDRETRREAIVVALRCRSWRCPCCSWRLVKRNRARAFLGVQGAARVALITLTVDPEDPTLQQVLGYYQDAGGGGIHGVFPAATIDYVRSIAWRRFRTYLAREYGRVPWLRGIELTRAGIAHVHVVVPLDSLADFWRLRLLIRGDEDGRVLRRGTWRKGLGWDRGVRSSYGLAERAGFGIVSDVQLARSNGDVVAYVSKATTDHPVASDGFAPEVVGGGGAAYATKGAADLRMPKYTRRVSWSGGQAAYAPGWVKPTPLAGFSWRVAPASARLIAPGMERSGFSLVDPDRFRVRAPGWHPPGEEVQA